MTHLAIAASHLRTHKKEGGGEGREGEDWGRKRRKKKRGQRKKQQHGKADIWDFQPLPPSYESRGF